MTAQISDTFRYREKPHSLAGVNGTGLFEPAQQGVKAFGWSTACWRGFHCSYEVADGALFLTQVNLGLDEEDSASAARVKGRNCSAGCLESTQSMAIAPTSAPAR